MAQLTLLARSNSLQFQLEQDHWDHTILLAVKKGSLRWINRKSVPGDQFVEAEVGKSNYGGDHGILLTPEEAAYAYEVTQTTMQLPEAIYRIESYGQNHWMWRAPKRTGFLVSDDSQLTARMALRWAPEEERRDRLFLDQDGWRAYKLYPCSRKRDRFDLWRRNARSLTVSRAGLPGTLERLCRHEARGYWAKQHSRAKAIWTEMT